MLRGQATGPQLLQTGDIPVRVGRLTVVLVGAQMGWVLRPFIGDPDMSPQFFRTETWGNAYVIVIEMIWSMLTG